MTTQPIFKSVFGDDWGKLPIVFKRHYLNRPYSCDENKVEGKMFVRMSLLMRAVSPLLKMTGTLIPRAGENVRVSVTFLSEQHDQGIVLNRVFQFSDGRKYCFRSRMVQKQANEVIEWTSSGIGWHTGWFYKNNQVVLSHLGYWMNFFGIKFPLPLTWLFGQTHALEMAIDDNSFQMEMHIVHPFWGELYSYGGIFHFNDEVGM